MADTRWTNRARTSVMSAGATLADGVRFAADFDNDVNKDLWCNVFLNVQYNTTTPTVSKVGELYVVPGDDESPETFPEGGDGTTGSDFTPQAIHLAGVFETINTSVISNEQIGLSGIPLYHSGNRFVFLNTSGQVMDLLWLLDIVPYTVVAS